MPRNISSKTTSTPAAANITTTATTSDYKIINISKS
jgi:hypothetical protein